jgi:hypothetical protein
VAYPLLIALGFALMVVLTQWARNHRMTVADQPGPWLLAGIHSR